MNWALVICFIFGASVAVWFPVLIFSLGVFILTVGFGVIHFWNGGFLLPTIVWAIAIAAVLEAGYIFTHITLYFFYVRRPRSVRFVKKTRSR